MASNNHASRELVGLSLRLHELAIHTGDLKHSGLAGGYEHNCGVHGCAILRKTIAWLEKTLAEGRPSSVMEYRDER